MPVDEKDLLLFSGAGRAAGEISLHIQGDTNQALPGTAYALQERERNPSRGATT
jgi:hypothetical protein